MADSYRARLFAVITIALAAGAISADAVAQSYPDRPIRLIVPYSPGGGASIMARTVSGPLSRLLGQNVIIENKAGAGGSIGTAFVAKAPADGYTVLLGHVGPLTVNMMLQDNVPYDTKKDFAPITFVGATHNLLVVHPSLPATSLKELIQLLKAKPKGINYASAGLGSGSHLAAVLFNSMAKTEMVHIPYKGNSPAMTDLMSGYVPVMFPSIITAAPLVAVGRVRALAVTTRKRLPTMPNVPAVAESLPGYESSVWYGILAPAGVPTAIIELLNRHLVEILEMPGVKESMSKQGAEIRSSSPQEFAALISSELEKWGRLLKQRKSGEQ